MNTPMIELNQNEQTDFQNTKICELFTIITHLKLETIYILLANTDALYVYSVILTLKILVLLLKLYII